MSAEDEIKQLKCMLAQQKSQSQERNCLLGAGAGGERALGPSALDKQEGGSHYKDMKIQPIEYIHANNMPFLEGTIIKYVSRWRSKGGLEDLRKAEHCIALLIALETK